MHANILQKSAFSFFRIAEGIVRVFRLAKLSVVREFGVAMDMNCSHESREWTEGDDELIICPRVPFINPEEIMVEIYGEHYARNRYFFRTSFFSEENKECKKCMLCKKKRD